MAKSERAKAFEAKQKAEARAEKERKRSSTDPADWGRWRQLVETYKMSAKYDKALPWLMLAGFVVPFALLLVVGFILNQPLIWGLVGVSAGFLGAMAIFAWRARRAVYSRYEGQAGSGEVALQMLPKQWVSDPVIAVTKNMDVVHRTLGPGGLILIGEGEAGRLKPLLQGEKRKHEQVAYGVEVKTIQMGKAAGQVPLDQLASHIKKMPKVLTPAKIGEVRQRLRALDAMRPKAPIPKGPISMKGSRAAMRGR
ncbi:DUF4191 domain-containing protein [Tessaracoccus sp. MC1865]|uniref:DUF4191 domain-containing protein n=1 Tax=unclassified Tessaracoccus TaxID=2635419 RepID=UPI001602B90D|nr:MULTISPECIES: DUF4191 domain-containing protein [unclassified Tessaracoccus]MBB1483667.1 DUF4191 domain-containing protein [Tessaracoccus sp. MC1865]MBB1508823.1 DUF4191 domain-containing protein [Tessaracoccus sp. MC1756]QTO36739.1 DUF4191 domain-containing protein [Tessaracoccus sp. MC1865]